MQRVADIDVVGGDALGEEALERTVLRDHLVHQPHQRGEIAAVGPAVDQGLEALAIARGIETADEGRRRRPITFSMPSMELSTLCTRPKASADATKATTS